MEKVILFHGRRAAQTFTRIWLLDQLLGMDLLPLSSLPITRQMTFLSPNTGDPVVLTPLSCSGITSFCVWSHWHSWDSNWFFTCMHIPKVGLHRRKEGGGTQLGCLLWMYQHPTHRCCSPLGDSVRFFYKHRTCFFIQINAQGQENGATR